MLHIRFFPTKRMCVRHYIPGHTENYMYYSIIYFSQNLLEEVNSFRAEYLFQPDKCYDTFYDIGMLSMSCSHFSLMGIEVNCSQVR